VIVQIITQDTSIGETDRSYLLLADSLALEVFNMICKGNRTGRRILVCVQVKTRAVEIVFQFMYAFRGRDVLRRAACLTAHR
jgi:hypothetical protein